MNEKWKNEINLRRFFERVSLIDGDVKVKVAKVSENLKTVNDVHENIIHSDTILNSERIIEELHNSSEGRFASSVHKFFPKLYNLFSSDSGLVILLETTLENDYKYIIPLRLSPRVGITNFELGVEDDEEIILGKFDFVC